MKPERELSAYTILETPLWRQIVSVMHERRAGLGGLRNEHAERAIEIQTFRQ